MPLVATEAYLGLRREGRTHDEAASRTFVANPSAGLARRVSQLTCMIVVQLALTFATLSMIMVTSWTR